MVQLLRPAGGQVRRAGGNAAASQAPWMVSVGGFFFRYRNTVFPAIFAVAVLAARPRIIAGHPGVDRFLRECGVVVALLGQAVRLATIGYEYIERGGKEGKVYASHLVDRGVYALTRNPMYLGNALIAAGMALVSGAPLLSLVVAPFFFFVYLAIIAAEEAYLARTFGEAYARYCAQVPRLLPAWARIPSALAGLRYNWRRAVRKDLSTLAGLAFGLLGLPLWRAYRLEGWVAAKAEAPRTLAALAVVGLLYAGLARLKRQRKFLYDVE